MTDIHSKINHKVSYYIIFNHNNPQMWHNSR